MMNVVMMMMMMMCVYIHAGAAVWEAIGMAEDDEARVA